MLQTKFLREQLVIRNNNKTLILGLGDFVGIVNNMYDEIFPDPFLGI